MADAWASTLRSFATAAAARDERTSCQSGYTRVDGRLWILVATPEHKTWWRNLRDGAAVDLLLAGRAVHGKATALDGVHHPDEVAEGLLAYARGMPRAARSLGLSPGSTDADVRRISRNVIMVRVDLGVRAAAKG